MHLVQRLRQRGDAGGRGEGAVLVLDDDAAAAEAQPAAAGQELASPGSGIRMIGWLGQPPSLLLKRRQSSRSRARRARPPHARRSAGSTERARWRRRRSRHPTRSSRRWRPGLASPRRLRGATGPLVAHGRSASSAACSVA